MSIPFENELICLFLFSVFVLSPSRYSAEFYYIESGPLELVVIY